MYQTSTSRSSRFQRSRGSTRVPTFGREFSSPLAFSILMASRTADRLMRSRLHHSASLGSSTSGREVAAQDARADLLGGGEMKTPALAPFTRLAGASS